MIVSLYINEYIQWFWVRFIYQDNLIINIHQCIVILIIDTSMLIIDRMNILFSNKMKPKFLQTCDLISKRIFQKTTKVGCSRLSMKLPSTLSLSHSLREGVKTHILFEPPKTCLVEYKGVVIWPKIFKKAIVVFEGFAVMRFPIKNWNCSKLTWP